MTVITLDKLDEPQRLFADLDRPTLHALSYALRHPDMWPEDFIWDFRTCETCAMGLAHRLWDGIKIYGATTEIVSGISREFAMSYAAAKDIFFGAAYTEAYLFGLRKRKVPLSRVTPDMVADAIDAYLARERTGA